MKTSMVWTISAIGFLSGFYILFYSGILGFLVMACSMGFALTITIKGMRDEAKTQNIRFIATKALYEKSLFDLQEDPGNSTKHQVVVAKGREYYSYLHPDTQDVNGNGIASNFRDNSGIVEAKVQSDIQARTMKRKIL